MFYFIIRDVLQDLVPFIQFEKHEKHQWRSVSFATLLKVISSIGVLISRFSNWTNGTKSFRALHIQNV